MHRSIRLALALAVSLMVGCGQAAKPPEAAIEAQPPMFVASDAAQVEELKLPNGLTVLLKPDRAAPVVTWMVWYRVGSRNEGVGITGSAHLLEHMLFKGTKSFRKGQIAQVLGRNGARFNASTSYDFTNYFETYASDRLDMGLAIEADRMRDALILDAERRPEMTVVRNELERGENEPSRILYQSVRDVAFLSHPYGHPIIGYRSDVEGVSTDKLKKFYDSYYHPNNAVAVLVGDFDRNDAVRRIQQAFGGIPKGPDVAEPYTEEETQSGERRIELRRRGETNLVSMAYKLPGALSPKTPQIAILESVLGGGSNSRLVRRLVDSGLATDVSVDAEQLRDAGLFWIEATLPQGGQHAKVEEAITEEIDRVRAEGVTPAEVAAAKNQAAAASAYRVESTSGFASALGQWWILGDWKRFFSLQEQMAAVEPEAVKVAAIEFLDPLSRTVGRYVATKDGPRIKRPDAGKGKATASRETVERMPLQAWESKAPMSRPAPDWKVRQLENGLVVSVLERPGAPTVSVQGWVQAGSLLDRLPIGSQEPRNRAGLAAITASMLERGTQKRDRLTLARDLDSVGASVTFSTGDETTGFRGRAVKKDAGLLLGATLEMLAQPAFPEAELKLLRDQQIARIREGEDQPAVRAARLLRQQLFSEQHPYHPADPEAQIASLGALTSADLKRFHEAFYGPDATRMVVVGDIAADEVFAFVENATAGWRRGLPDFDLASNEMLNRLPANAADSEPSLLPTFKAPPTQARGIASDFVGEAANVEVRIGCRLALKRSERSWYAMRVMNHLLGGSTLTGRLGLRLRDQLGLTYGVTSGFSPARGVQGRDGVWTTGITVNRDNVDTAIEEFRKVLDGFVAADTRNPNGITPEDIADARNALVGDLAVSLSSMGGVAGYATELMDHFDVREADGPRGLKARWEEYARMMGDVNRDGVIALFRGRIRKDDLRTVVSGPWVPAGERSGTP